MSFLNSFKKALGFPGDYEYDSDDADELDNDLDLTSPRPRPIKVEIEKAYTLASSESQPKAEQPEIDDPALTGRIFDAVIELFNSTQPEFVRECLSKDSQRAYILSHISESVRETLDRHTALARARGEEIAAERQKQMTDEIEHIKSDYNALKQQREEFKNAQLSASRQRRAMTERIADLESQVNNLMAEREQYQLENRSMANKLRIAGMRVSDSDAADFARIMEQVDSLTKEKEAMAAKITELQQQLESSALTAQSEDAHRAELEEIENRLAGFEQIKQRKNQRIEELQNKLSEANSKNQQLNGDTENLRRECDELRAEVKRLSAMINMSDSPRQRGKQHKHKKNNETAETAKPADQPTKAPKQPAVKISAIDELMDSTDWFTVAEPIPPKKDPEVDEDFGYREPARPAPHSDSDKQLSLF